MWENYAIVTNLASQPKKYQKAVFLCTIGQSALDIHNSFHFNDDEDRSDIATMISKFDKHFTGEVNETYERFQFNRRTQQSGENFECYLTALRNLAKSCNFFKCMSDSLIRDQIVLGIRDDNARKRLLQERKLDVKHCIDICRSTESANAQLGEINESFASVCNVDNTKEKPTRFRPQTKPRASKGPKESKCKFCLTTHAFRKELCPAWGKRCSVCGEKKHWRGSMVCKRKERTNAVEIESDDYDSDFERLFTLEHLVNGVGHKTNQNTIMCEMFIESRKVKMQNKYRLKFVVVDEELAPLLSRKAAERMGLITVNYDQFESVNTVNAIFPKQITDQFPDLFDDQIGSFPGTVKLTLKEGAQPVICPPKRIPLEEIDNVKAETRTRLPTTNTLLQPKVVEKEAEQIKMKKQQQRQAHYYDRKARELTPLHVGDTVRMKPFTLGDKSWKKGLVTARIDDRSYMVENQDGRPMRRNRVHLRKSNESSAAQAHDDPEIEQRLEKGNTEDTQEQNIPGEEQIVTRSGRPVRKPVYLKDYVTR
ncbi:hypothetical protein AC249_AIPGENE8700 [Exaiptasia diaphana]|nr:hypothetical protein AC249_AIPGENE8700 [Exaiptasia diaphana]